METKLRAVRVKHIILSKTDPKAIRMGLGPDAVGMVQFCNIEDDMDYHVTMPIAKPAFSFLRNYPVKDEIVYLIDGPNNTFNIRGTLIAYYLPPLSIFNNPQHNSNPTFLKYDTPPLMPDEVEGTEASNTPEESKIDLGDYFRELEFIRPLMPYEGDVILEGRYGNSIRFGGTVDNLNVDKPNRWSNEGEIGNPITIIRNGQVENEQEENYDHILEDVSGDDSSIYLCSKQQLTDFMPASLNQLSFG